MITRLEVRNFKSLRELEVEFGRLTVLVGANGCGKSSVLQAIKLVRDLLLREKNQSDPFNAEFMSRSADGVASDMYIQVNSGAGDEALVAVAELVPLTENPHELDHRSSIRCESTVARYDKDPFIDIDDVPPWVQTAFAGVQLYQLDTRIMERPAYSDEPNPVLGDQGENLGAVLDALQGSKREQFEVIEAHLCRFIQGLQRVRLRRVPVSTYRRVRVDNDLRHVEDRTIGHQVVLDFEFARSIPAAQVSEGTILLLGLLTVIGTEPGPPRTVMLDDLDRALHPKAQKQLVEHLRTLVETRPDLQIIATSHSPYLVEHLAYEEVRAMTQSPVDGSSRIASLNEHPDAARWRDEMSAGEFWSSVGEDWIERDRPQ